MEKAPDFQDFRERLTASEENARYQTLLSLQEVKAPWPPALVEQVRQLEVSDPSRPVRQLARVLYQRQRPELVEEASPLPSPSAPEPYPGSGLLALISFGSSLTGVIGTAMSLLNYYLLKKFPFPEPLDVLLVVNLVLTAPYVALGMLQLLPGRFQKAMALYYAYFSLVLVLVLVGGLQYYFDLEWAVQFTLADQAQLRHFLSPLSLLLALLPVVAGQTMMIYFLNQLLAPRRRPGPAEAVDTAPREG